MTFEEVLIQLLNQAQNGNGRFLTEQSLGAFSSEHVQRMLQEKMVVESQPSQSYTCRDCSEHCTGIELSIHHCQQTDRRVGLFFCCKTGGEGMKTVDLDSLRRWEIVPEKIQSYLQMLNTPEECRYPRTSKMMLAQANDMVLYWIPRLTKELKLKTNADFRKITIRMLAGKIGCSASLVAKCLAWQKFHKQRTKHQSSSSKSVRLPTMDVATFEDDPAIQAEQREEELRRLTQEQKTDMANQDGQNKVYPGR